MITGLILLGTRYDKFYDTTGPPCPAGTEGEAFVNGDKFKLMSYAMLAHAAGAVLHWLHQIFNNYEMRVFGTIFIVLKLIIFFVIMIVIQSSTDFNDCP